MPPNSKMRTWIKRGYWNFRAFFYEFNQICPLVAPLARKEYDSIRQMWENCGVDASEFPILNLGCGFNPPLGGSSGGSLMIGLDWSLRMLRRARRKSCGWSFIAGDSIQIPLMEMSVGMVLALGLTEYIDEAEAWMEEVNRVLKPGGTLIFSSAQPNLINRIRRIWSPGLYLRTPAQWREECSRFKLKEVDYRVAPLQCQFMFVKTKPERQD